jgi:uncharacterized protein (UPF0335 family)
MLPQKCNYCLEKNIRQENIKRLNRELKELEQERKNLFTSSQSKKRSYKEFRKEIEFKKEERERERERESLKSLQTTQRCSCKEIE